MGTGWEVKVSVLNIRSGPGTSYEDIGDAHAGDILSSPEGWIPVVLEDDSIGWVSEQYVDEVEVEDIPSPIPGKVTGKHIVAKAMTQAGDPYIFGTEVDLDDPDPDAFDCSELVQWVCAQLGVVPKMPDGAVYQRNHCQQYNTMIPLSQAVKTPGALLFRIQADGSNHVVISRGDGSTIEAKGSAYGVGVFSLNAKNFTHAAKIPGVAYA